MKGTFDSTQLRIWLAIVGASTLVLGASYTMVQQATRLSADDLPLTTAQTIQQELHAGATPNDVIPPLKTDLKTDNSTFVIITDESQHVLASSATLNGQTPLPPKGVFSFTLSHDSDHFTWQPTSGVRLATRVVTFSKDANSGFVITGQSLAPYEDRVTVYTELAIAAWLATLAWTFLTLLLPGYKIVKPSSKSKLTK
jgi:hypothetical protein